MGCQVDFDVKKYTNFKTFYKFYNFTVNDEWPGERFPDNRHFPSVELEIGLADTVHKMNSIY